VLHRAGCLLAALLEQRECIHRTGADDWNNFGKQRSGHRTISTSACSAAARLVGLTNGSARNSCVAEVNNETLREDFMKYLLLIASLAAVVAASPVSAQINACCKGKQCCNASCCKK
jgi:hypothetical protein